MTCQKIIVSGIWVKDGKVFVSKRSINKKIAPGKYHLPGGHVEFGEDPEVALKREFQEEFKLDIKIKDVFRTFSYMFGDTHTVGISFLIEIENLPEKIWFDPDDTEEIVWLDPAEAGQYFDQADHDFVTIRKYADENNQ